MTADNRFEIYVNGKEAGSGNNYQQVNEVQVTQVDIAKYLRPGRNVFAVAAFNAGGTPKPAGLLGRFVIDFDQGPPLIGVTDKTWKTSQRELSDWIGMHFDDFKLGSGPGSGQRR